MCIWKFSGNTQNPLVYHHNIIMFPIFRHAYVTHMGKYLQTMNFGWYYMLVTYGHFSTNPNISRMGSLLARTRFAVPSKYGIQLIESCSSYQGSPKWSDPHLDLQGAGCLWPWQGLPVFLIYFIYGGRTKPSMEIEVIELWNSRGRPRPRCDPWLSLRGILGPIKPPELG